MDNTKRPETTRRKKHSSIIVLAKATKEKEGRENWREGRRKANEIPPYQLFG
jgi:hypothetical protein